MFKSDYKHWLCPFFAPFPVGISLIWSADSLKLTSVSPPLGSIWDTYLGWVFYTLPGDCQLNNVRCCLVSSIGPVRFCGTLMFLHSEEAQLCLDVKRKNYFCWSGTWIGLVHCMFIQFSKSLIIDCGIIYAAHDYLSLATILFPTPEEALWSVTLIPFRSQERNWEYFTLFKAKPCLAY